MLCKCGRTRLFQRLHRTLNHCLGELALEVQLLELPHDA